MILRCLAFMATMAILAEAFYEAPDDCDWTFIDDESGFAGGVSLTCHLSAINSHLEKTNFSVIPTEGTKKLTVKCKDPALSQLEARGFAGLFYLEELVIDSCRLEHIPALGKFSQKMLIIAFFGHGNCKNFFTKKIQKLYHFIFYSSI